MESIAARHSYEPRNSQRRGGGPADDFKVNPTALFGLPRPGAPPACAGGTSIPGKTLT